MEEFIASLKNENASLNQQAAELRAQNKGDEAVFCTVKANVYDICATVCSVWVKKGDISACESILNRFRGENGVRRWRPQNGRKTPKRSALKKPSSRRLPTCLPALVPRGANDGQGRSDPHF